MSVSGKSKVYTPTETGKRYIQQKLSEFNSVSHHILSEILNRNVGTFTGMRGTDNTCWTDRAGHSEPCVIFRRQAPDFFMHP